jgi:ATP-dependent DNA helicase RecG
LEQWPEIDFVDDREGCLFTATIHRKTEEEPSDRKGSPIGSPIGSPKTDDRILELMEQDTFITKEKLGIVLGISKRTILKQIEKLKSQGRLVRVGPTRGGHWKVLT